MRQTRGIFWGASPEVRRKSAELLGRGLRARAQQQEGGGLLAQPGVGGRAPPPPRPRRAERTRASSISRTENFSPPRLMISFTRPVMDSTPSAVTKPRSPVRNQPSSSKDSAVCWPPRGTRAPAGDRGPRARPPRRAPTSAPSGRPRGPRNPGRCGRRSRSGPRPGRSGSPETLGHSVMPHDAHGLHARRRRPPRPARSGWSSRRRGSPRAGPGAPGPGRPWRPAARG